MTDTDALASYAARGDAEAFRTLVEQHQHMVYAVCLRILRNVGDAEDAVQETFLKLARNAGSIRTNVAAWLHRCAATTALDAYRRKVTRGRHESAAAAERPTKQAAPGSETAWTQIQPLLDEALLELDEPAREAVVAHYLEGVPQRELADAASVSPSAMSRRITAAVEQLRTSLQAKGLVVTVAALTAGLAADASVAAPPAMTASLSSIGLTGVGGTSAAATGVGLKVAGALVAAALLGSAALVTLIATGTGPFGSAAASPPPVQPSAQAPTQPATAEPAATTPESRPAFDPGSLAGAWQGQIQLVNGDPTDQLLTIDGDDWIFTDPASARTERFRLEQLDTSVTPAIATFRELPGLPGNAEALGKCLVDLRDGELLIALNNDGTQPASLDAPDAERGRFTRVSLRELDGHWIGADADVNGGMHLLVTGDGTEWEFANEDRSIVQHLSVRDLDTTAAPWQAAWSWLEAGQGSPSGTGIITFTDSRLRLATNRAGEAPPASFDAPAYEKFEFTRLDLSEELAALQGEWEGEEIGNPDVQRICTLEGNVIKLRSPGGAEWYDARIVSADLNATPHRFVAWIVDCPAPSYVGKQVYTIFKIEQVADTRRLTYCSLGPGVNRYPTAFDQGRTFWFDQTPPADEGAAQTPSP